MNNHTITIERVSGASSYLGRTPAHDYQAKCSCGWVSNPAWLKSTIRRVAEYHTSAAMITSTA
jgi:hypothetical protein